MDILGDADTVGTKVVLRNVQWKSDDDGVVHSAPASSGPRRSQPYRGRAALLNLREKRDPEPHSPTSAQLGPGAYETAASTLRTGSPGGHRPKERPKPSYSIAAAAYKTGSVGPGEYDPPPLRSPSLPVFSEHDVDHVEHARSDLQYRARMRKAKHGRKRGQLSLEEFRMQQEWEAIATARGGADLAPACQAEPDALCLVYHVEPMGPQDPQLRAAQRPDPFGDGFSLWRPRIGLSAHSIERLRKAKAREDENDDDGDGSGRDQPRLARGRRS